MLLFLLGCADKTVPTPDTVATDTATTPTPWAELEAVPLEGMRALMVTPLLSPVDLKRLATLPSRSLTAVLDGPDVLILDPLYHQSSTAHCVSATEWPDWGHAERQGDCPEGQVQTRRGKLTPEVPAIDAAFDSVELTLTVLTADGSLQIADADLLGDNPLDFLRLGEPVEIGLGALDTTARLAVSSGSVAIAAGTTLTIDGAITALPGIASAVAWVDGGVWVLTDAGVWADGEVVSASGSTMAAGEDAVWVGGSGSVSWIDRDSHAVQTLTIDGATGPIAVDGQRAYAATSDGIAVIEDGAEITRYLQDAPIDLAIGPPHEILALTSAEVQVFLNETALSGGDALDVVLTAFVEKPRNESSDADCRGDGTTITSYVEQAMANHTLLADLPLPATIGITPFFAQRAAECDLIDTLTPLVDAADVGVLYHSPTPDDCDTDCLAEWMAGEAAKIAALGVEPTWASGLGAKDDLDDFTDLLRQSGGPDRYLFFGISALPEISHDADPRAKNSWPIETGQRSSAWRIDHADELVEGVAGGWLTVYPGDNIPLFNLGGCANLLLRECHQLGQGGSGDIEADDTTALTLMLHRALADRDGPSTFSFHLPDLGVYDYTADCTVTDRVWSGEECQGAVLQDWAMDVWQRHVLNGTARMSIPAELDRPE
ncbi:MAG: hypothetical protein ACI8RZ_003459 [Myxococcota bacterium]|jgi:hypothetical protein